MNNKATESLGYLTAKASFSLAAQLNREFLKYGIDLPHSQFIILSQLYETDGQTQQELADALFKNKSAIKRTVDNLELRSYVKRIEKGKSFRIFLTDTGLMKKTELLKISEKTTKSILGIISKRDYERCAKILKKIIKNTDGHS